MVFDPATTVEQIPTTIKAVVVLLQDSLEDSGPVQSAKFRLIVHDQNGQEMAKRSGQLAPHLTASQISQLQTFMAEMRTLAEDILPGGQP